MRRSIYETVTEVLQACGSPIKISNLMGKCNMSYNKLKPMVDRMVASGWLTFDGQYYTVTTYGLELFDLIGVAKDIIGEL